MNWYMTIIEQAALGSVIGYGTNWLAIRLLFQPYRKKKLGPFSFGPGVLVRHQGKLASEIASLAAGSILTVDSLKSKLAGDDLVQYFKAQMGIYFEKKLSEDFGSLENLVPKEMERDFRELVLFTRGRLLDTVRNYITEDSFSSQLSASISDQLNYIGKQPLGSIISEKRRELLLDSARKVLCSCVKAESTTSNIANFTGNLLDQFFKREEPIRSLFPKKTLETAVTQFENIAVSSIISSLYEADFSKLAGKVENQLRKHVEKLLESDGGVFDNIASWAIKGLKRKKIEKAVGEFSSEFPVILRDFLVSEEGSEVVSSFVKKSISELLDTSPKDLSRKLGKRGIETLYGGVSQLVAEMLRSENLVNQIHSFFREFLTSIAEDRIDKVIKNAGIENLEQGYLDAGNYIAEKLRSGEPLDKLLSRISVLFRELLAKPIGKPDRFIPKQVVESATDLLNSALFDYLLIHSAKIIQSLELEDTIERKIAAWEPEELHKMINRAAKNNLRSLEILGGLIGLLVGAASGILSVLLSS